LASLSALTLLDAAPRAGHIYAMRVVALFSCERAIFHIFQAIRLIHHDFITLYFFVAPPFRHSPYADASQLFFGFRLMLLPAAAAIFSSCHDLRYAAMTPPD